MGCDGIDGQGPLSKRPVGDVDQHRLGNSEVVDRALGDSSGEGSSGETDWTDWIADSLSELAVQASDAGADLWGSLEGLFASLQQDPASGGGGSVETFEPPKYAPLEVAIIHEGRRVGVVEFRCGFARLAGRVSESGDPIGVHLAMFDMKLIRSDLEAGWSVSPRVDKVSTHGKWGYQEVTTISFSVEQTNRDVRGNIGAGVDLSHGVAGKVGLGAKGESPFEVAENTGQAGRLNWGVDFGPPLPDKASGAIVFEISDLVEGSGPLDGGVLKMDAKVAVGGSGGGASGIYIEAVDMPDVKGMFGI